MNSYHYLLKFIVIGDTGNCFYIQVLENRALSSNLSKTKLVFLTMSLLEFNLELRLSKFKIKTLNYRYGTQLGNRISDQSQGPITGVLLVLY